MSSTRRVTFFLQCYNHERWVEQSIRSAAEQRADRTEVEIEVIDDGSTDGSRQVIERLASEIDFLYTPQTNIGLVPSLEEQLSRCDSDYICLQSTDDYWHPDKLAKQIEVMERNPEIPVCLTAALSVDSSGAPHPSRYQHFLRPPTDRIDFEALFTKQIDLCAASALIRRSALTGPPFFPAGTLLEDFYLWLELTRHHGEFTLLTEPLTYYRIHDSNLHHNMLPLMRDAVEILRLHDDHPLFPRAMRQQTSSFFSALADDDRLTALRFWREYPAWTRHTLKGVIKLILPRKATEFLKNRLVSYYS